MSSYNTALGAIAIAVCLVLAACQEGSQSGAEQSGTRSKTLEDLDLGGDWFGPTDVAESGAESTAVSGTIAPTARTSYWGVVLGTYSETGHAEAAANMSRNVAAIDPRLGAAHVHSTPRGSVVVYGVYEGAEDPQAQAALEWIKSLQRGGRKIFPRAILSRLQSAEGRADRDKLALASVRRRYPDVNPLYSVQVAVWGIFDSKSLTYDEVCRRSTAYTLELRAGGHEAYHHHDPDLKLSMVTVGVFDRTAVDAQSGFYAPEIERLFRDFPAHLVNGQPLNELIDPRRPERGTRVQQPRLVVVPK